MTGLAARIAALEYTRAKSAQADPRDYDRWNSFADALMALPDVPEDTKWAAVGYLRRMWALGPARGAAPNAEPTALFFLMYSMPPEYRATLTPNLFGPGAPWLSSWAQSLAFRESRLPPGITPETVAAVARGFERPPPGHIIPAVCDECGLQRADNGAECPYCGASASTVASRTAEQPRPWREAATRELAAWETTLASALKLLESGAVCP